MFAVKNVPLSLYFFMLAKIVFFCFTRDFSPLLRSAGRCCCCFPAAAEESRASRREKIDATSKRDLRRERKDGDESYDDEKDDARGRDGDVGDDDRKNDELVEGRFYELRLLI